MLGLATGPICLASCGPVVVPWMLVQPQGIRPHSLQLSLFLGARLAGYLMFAAAVWLVGASIPHAWAGRPWLLGIIEMFLAAALLVYAAGWPRRHCVFPKREQAADLVQIGTISQRRSSGALVLGFLTGINLCPPFLAAGVRAAQLDHLSSSLLFFLAFFAGTAVWFLPFLSLGIVRRTQALVIVARVVAALLACWYGISGVSILVGRAFYG